MEYKEIINKGNSNQSMLTPLYSYIFILPILLFKILGKSKSPEGQGNFLIILILYLLISFPLSIIEYKLPFLYAIGRIKTSIYPIVFLLLYDLKDIRISKTNIIPIMFFAYIICTNALYRIYQYLIA